MVRVKICGLTNEADARHAVAHGAAALGFNSWPGSPRFLDLERAGEWIAALPPFVTKVALLVNATLDEARRFARLPYLDALQLHGDEGPEYCSELALCGKPLIKALRVRVAKDLEGLEVYPTRHFLIDAHVKGLFGGTGVAADLALASEFGRKYPANSLILAGGLNAENVAAAIREVRPAAVDVSSGVESGPGRKDAEKVRAFIAAAREPQEAE